MSFLSTLGKVFTTVPKVLQAVQPSTMLIAGMLPTGPGGRVLDVFNGTAAIVAQTENAVAAFNAIDSNSALSGAQKAQMALPQVAALLQVNGFMFDKKVVDPVMFQAGCKSLIDGTVAIMNSVVQKTPDEINRDQQTIAVQQMKLQGQFDGGSAIMPIGPALRKQ